MILIKYDFAGWQERMGWAAGQAADALDVSVGFYYKMKRDGEARKIYVYAAYGYECEMAQRRGRG